MGSSQGVPSCQGTPANTAEAVDTEMEGLAAVEDPRGLPLQAMLAPSDSTPRGDGDSPHPDDSTNEDIIQEWQRTREDLSAKLAALSAKLREQDALAQKLLDRSKAPRCSCTCGSSRQEGAEADDEGQPRQPSQPSRLSQANTTTSMQPQIPADYNQRPESLDIDPATDIGARRPSLKHDGPLRVTRSSSTKFFESGNEWFQRVWKPLYKHAKWLNNLTEPKREGPLAVILESKVFEFLVVAAIFASVLFTIWSTNDTAMRIRSGAVADVKLTLYVELVFCIFFAVEVTARIALHRLYFFVNENWGWNWFDLILVVSAIVNLIYDQFVGYSIGNVTFLRAFRLMRVTRILRLLRVIKFFRKLSQVLDALLTSIRAVGWVIVLLCSLFLAFALIFVQLVSEYLQNLKDTNAMDGACKQALCECDEREILLCSPTEALVHYFGSVQKAMISLYMATTGGLDWTNIWDVLVKTGFWNAMFFLLFTFLFIFCIFNLLTGLFVNQALNSAQKDKDIKVIEQREKEKEKLGELQKIVQEADKDNDGNISPKEFEAMMKDNNVLFWLHGLGLDIADPKLFFDLMLTTSGKEGDADVLVPIDLFLEGCMRMKGGAKSIDLQAMGYKVQLIMERQMDLQEKVLKSIGYRA